MQVRFCFSAVCDFFVCFWIKYLAPDSRARHVWSLARMSLNVIVEGHGHGTKYGKLLSHAAPSPPGATEWNALAANNVMHQQTGPFRRCWGWFRRLACGLCLVKTSLKVICNGFSQNWWKVVSSCLLQYKPVCVINFDKLRSKMLKSRSLVVSLV